MQRWYNENKLTVTPWLFLLPAMVMFAIYVIYPIGQSFNTSLYKWDGLSDAEYVGLANYEKLLTDDRAFNTSLWNNAKWLVFYLLAIPAGLSSRYS